MSKSVGGFIQLIIPSEEMKWADYKKKYGIDLDDYFEINTINDVPTVGFKPYINKPILISGFSESHSGKSYGTLLDCGFLTCADMAEDGTLYLIFGDRTDTGLGLKCFSDRRVARLDI